MLMLPIAQAYCKAGKPEEGKRIGEKLFQMYYKNLRYYKSLGDGMSSFQRDVNEAVYVVFQIQQMAETFKMNDLKKAVDPVFEQFKNDYRNDKDDGE